MREIRERLHEAFLDEPVDERLVEELTRDAEQFMLISESNTDAEEPTKEFLLNSVIEHACRNSMGHLARTLKLSSKAYPRPFLLRHATRLLSSARVVMENLDSDERAELVLAQRYSHKCSCSIGCDNCVQGRLRRKKIRELLEAEIESSEQRGVVGALAVTRSRERQASQGSDDCKVVGDGSFQMHQPKPKRFELPHPANITTYMNPASIRRSFAGLREGSTQPPTLRDTDMVVGRVVSRRPDILDVLHYRFSIFGELPQLRNEYRLTRLGYLLRVLACCPSSVRFAVDESGDPFGFIVAVPLRAKSIAGYMNGKYGAYELILSREHVADGGDADGILIQNYINMREGKEFLQAIAGLNCLVVETMIDWLPPKVLLNPTVPHIVASGRNDNGKSILKSSSFKPEGEPRLEYPLYSKRIGPDLAEFMLSLAERRSA